MILVRKWNNWKSMEIVETIYTHFQKVLFFICSDHILQHSEYFHHRKMGWNQLNNWKKSFLYLHQLNCLIKGVTAKYLHIFVRNYFYLKFKYIYLQINISFLSRAILTKINTFSITANEVCTKFRYYANNVFRNKRNRACKIPC